MNKSKEVTIQATFPLSGTLTIPSESRTTYPAVLIIAGSGKGDRDGNIKKMKLNIYKNLAELPRQSEMAFAEMRQARGFKGDGCSAP